MRQGDVVHFLHTDHLGSTSLTTDATGAPIAQTRYRPYGEERWQNGETPTDFTFTGQRAGFGLLDYNARYYDSGLGRFISPDTVIPDPTNPQNFNRYSYVLGNPLKFIDPSGHSPCLDADCDWIQSPTGKVVWNGEKANPAKQGYWSCRDTLANCHRQGIQEGSKNLKQFDHYQNIDPNEIKDLTIAIKEDLKTQDTSLWSDAIHGANLLTTRRYSGGRYNYDTPLWDGGQFDATICVDGQGCWKRTEVNYIAQGMWGAAAGKSLEDTLWAPQQWNETMYGHPAEEGELYWTEYGWKM